MSGFALSKILSSSVAVAALVVFAGCGGSSSSVPTVPGLSGMSEESLKDASSIFSQLGGMSGVQALSNSFGAKMGVNANITKFLDVGAIDAVEGGLTNTLATLGGQTVPAGSSNLLGTLSGKGLDKTAMEGMSTALAEAGKEKNLEKDQVSALESMMSSISSQLLK